MNSARLIRSLYGVSEMSFGLKIWANQTELRLSSVDRPVRITQVIPIPEKLVPGATTYSQDFNVVNFDPVNDGAIVTGGEAGYLAYDAPDVEDGFIPLITPSINKVTVTWRGYDQAHNRTIRYMPAYLIILRHS